MIGILSRVGFILMALFLTDVRWSNAQSNCNLPIEGHDSSNLITDGLLESERSLGFQPERTSGLWVFVDAIQPARLCQGLGRPLNQEGYASHHISLGDLNANFQHYLTSNLNLLSDKERECFLSGVRALVSVLISAPGQEVVRAQPEWHRTKRQLVVEFVSLMSVDGDSGDPRIKAALERKEPKFSVRDSWGEVGNPVLRILLASGGKCFYPDERQIMAELAN